jgi:hypothetical protein
MNIRRVVVGSILGLGLLAGGVTIAQGPPADNVNPHRNPNLAAAQRLITQAFDKIAAAQRSNEFDMEGHAQKAKDLLDQANRELKMAAEAADHPHH